MHSETENFKNTDRNDQNVTLMKLLKRFIRISRINYLFILFGAQKLVLENEYQIKATITLCDLSP